MYNIENEWTNSIAELLRKNLDLNKYEIKTLEKLPYSINIKEYDKNDNPQCKFMKYETDLLIKEKINNEYIPRIVIESKYKSITTHDVITYSNKSKQHKEIHSYLRYGIMIGNSETGNIPARLIQHGNEFDFMLAFKGHELLQEETIEFINIIKRQLEYSKILEKIICDRRLMNKKKYFSFEKQLNFGGIFL